MDSGMPKCLCGKTVEQGTKIIGIVYIVLGIVFITVGFITILFGGFGFIVNAIFCLALGICAFFAVRKRDSCLAVIAFVLIVCYNLLAQSDHANVQIIMIVMLIIALIATISVFIYLEILFGDCEASNGCTVNKNAHGIFIAGFVGSILVLLVQLSVDIYCAVIVNRYRKFLKTVSPGGQATPNNAEYGQQQDDYGQMQNYNQHAGYGQQARYG